VLSVPESSSILFFCCLSQPFAAPPSCQWIVNGFLLPKRFHHPASNDAIVAKVIAAEISRFQKVDLTSNNTAPS
jgi:hypothetical protein